MSLSRMLSPNSALPQLDLSSHLVGDRSGAAFVADQQSAGSADGDHFDPLPVPDW